jgi:hypothetical protein
MLANTTVMQKSRGVNKKVLTFAENGLYITYTVKNTIAL